MGRFETEWLATHANLAALTDLSGGWIDRAHDRRPPSRSSSTWTVRCARPTASRGRRGTATSTAHATTPFLFNQFGDLERCLLRRGDAHSAEDWRLVLEPVIARYRERGIALYFRADAAFAKPKIYELLGAEGIRYAIRLPANQVLQRRIGHLLTRAGWPTTQEAGGDVHQLPLPGQGLDPSPARGVVAKVEWHQGELWPRVGFIVTNLTRPNRAGGQVLQRPWYGRAVDSRG